MDQFPILKQLADNLAAQFGSDCEVVIYDLQSNHPTGSIAYLVNGQVTGGRIGDKLPDSILDLLRTEKEPYQDRYGYLEKTPDGKLLKCSTSYIHDEDGSLHYIFSIHYDITRISLIESALQAFSAPGAREDTPKKAAPSVNQLLEQLLEESVALVGKPVPLMSKADKIKAIQFLNDSGAFLITKSGDRVAGYFGISKYTLYSYIDINK